jgi:hypothetical protein
MPAYRDLIAGQLAGKTVQPGACSGVAVLAEQGPQRLPEAGRSSVA